jgi:HPt (histidine-containing phosphotransfer) domain-containing protein
LPISNRALPAQTEIVGTSDTIMVLDRAQLSEVTLEDEELMRELLAALIADTEQQMPLLDVAIRTTNLQQCARLAHYCKGACANVGAKAAATVLAELERSAKSGAPEECSRQLAALATEVDRLRCERI